LDEAFVETWANTQGFRLGKPQTLAIAPDGTVLFRRTAARERRADLHLLAPYGGDRVISVDTLLGGASEALSNQERARRERTRTTTSGIVDVDLSADGRRILIPLGERVFVFDRDKDSALELDLGEGYPLDPRISPDGQNVSFVRDGDLWVTALAKGRPRKLTTHEKDIEYGSAEFVAQEEFGRTRGYWWSPDSQTLVFQKSDLRKVDTLYVADARHPDRAPVPFKYPQAGANNAIVSLALQALRGGAPRFIAWDQARWPYVANVQWPEHGPLSLIVLNRAQTELALLAVDAQSGATRVLVTAQDPAWVNVPVGAPLWLEDGSGFLWMTEGESGWTLERRDGSGALLKTLTAPDFGLRAISGQDPKNAAAVVLASTDPRQQHVWRVPLDGSPARPFTDGGGVNTALVRHGVTVISGALHGGGTSSLVIHADGRPEQLPSVAERPELVPTTEFESVEVHDNGERRTLYTAITRPRKFNPQQRYPVLLKVYGGPGVTNVLDYRDGYTLDQWYADAGFVVMRADGRGTPNRGRAWERAIKDDLITLPLHDQVVALDAMIARHPELDRDRVGLFGWSFGGYLASMALLLRPDVFKAAVAGAPVSDWSLYDSAYSERYLRTPQDNPEGYLKSSALTHAGELKRPLLIIHGVTDDNVHFAHTLAFIEALFRAGKRAELITLPTTHLLADPKLSLAREKVQIDFFREHLGANAR
jgi:dipeptidyl-peptidase-4